MGAVMPNDADSLVLDVALLLSTYKECVPVTLVSGDVKTTFSLSVTAPEEKSPFVGINCP